VSTPRRPRGAMTEEDLRVWAEVARTVRPLRGKKLPAIIDKPNHVADATDAARDIKLGARRTQAAKARSHGEASAAPPPPPLAMLERRFVQRLRRGTAAPGAVLDLHGLRQEEARWRLSAFLHRCQAEGTKAALVITGKGAQANALGDDRGVLRRAVPLWLAMPDLRPLVVGVQEAGAGLGGTGALILRVRARRHRT
jgi:DNA-nicking Smr family endonuclease